MTGTETTQNTVYVTRLSPDDTRHIRDDLHSYPFPNWRFDVLDVGAPPPLNLLSGQAILVVGCGDGARMGHAEAMWLLRLFACGCPWVAVSGGSSGADRELCEAAGAAAYHARPFSPAKLRELIWYNAVPHAGKTPVTPLTCDRLVRYFAVLGVDALLKFSTEAGRTGYLSLQGGRPVHAKVLDGGDGEPALREILNWGRGKVLGLPFQPDTRRNLPDQPEAWGQLLRAPAGTLPLPPRTVPGGREACDLVAHDIPDVTACALLDLRSGTVAARPTATRLQQAADDALVAAAADLLRHPFHLGDPAGSLESAEEIVVLTRDGWWAASKLGTGGLAMAVSAAGLAPLGLAREALAAAASELERRSGMVVE